MKLSVIIVSYNVRDFLQQCLSSVKRASENIDCEVIVIDNNSDDDSRTMVSSLFPEVKLIRNTFNAGYAKACNLAIEKSSGEFILILNPDTIISEDSLRKSIEFMETFSEAGALGAMMIDGNGKYLRESKRSFPSPLTSFFKMTGLSRLFPHSPFFSKYYMEHIDRNETAEVEVLTGAFMFLRRDTIIKTGLFDENFFMYGEDIDLSYRIIKTGYKIYYCPEIKIIHFKGESSRKSPVSSIIYFYKAMLVFARKHFSEKDILLFHLILKPAIYLHWSASMIRKALLSILPLLADAITVFLIIFITALLWGKFRPAEKSHFSGYFTLGVSIAFTLACIASVLITGGYHQKKGYGTLFKGLLSGCFLIILANIFMPEKIKFPYTFVLSGSLAVILVIPVVRTILAIIMTDTEKLPFKQHSRTVIVCDKDNYKKIIDLLTNSYHSPEIIGRVRIKNDKTDENVLGNLEQLDEIIRNTGVNEVVFSLKDITASKIIELINKKTIHSCVRISFVPEGENMITGSKRVIKYQS